MPTYAILSSDFVTIKQLTVFPSNPTPTQVKNGYWRLYNVSSKPAYEPSIQKVIEDTPTITTGTYTVNWQVVPLNSGEIAAFQRSDHPLNSRDIFITLTGNYTVLNPASPINGEVIKWHFKQGGTGSSIISLDSKFVLPSSATTPLPWSTGVNKTDLLAGIYNSGDDKLYIVSLVPGY